MTEEVTDNLQQAIAEFAPLMEQERLTLWQQAETLIRYNLDSSETKKLGDRFGAKYDVLMRRKLTGTEYKSHERRSDVSFTVHTILVEIADKETRLALLHGDPAGGGKWTVDAAQHAVREWKKSQAQVTTIAGASHIGRSKRSRVLMQKGAVSVNGVKVTVESFSDDRIKITVETAVTDVTVKDASDEGVIWITLPPEEKVATG